MSSSPQDYFKFQNGRLCAENADLCRLAKKFGTPLYVYSEQALLDQLHAYQEGLAPIDHLVCFAAKSNSNLALLRLLGKAGAGADLVSGGELFRALKAGIRAEKMLYSGVGKTNAEIEQALRAGVYALNVESVAELATINQIAGALGFRARVSFRFNPHIDAKTHPHISTGLKKNKFGITEQELLSLTKNLHRYPNIELRGLSIHIGSQILSLKPLATAFKSLSRLAQKIETLLPHKLEFLDLGGGLGISYGLGPSPSIREYCRQIVKHFDGQYRILIEPGRSIVGNSGALITEVLYRKEQSGKNFVIVDAGMNDLIRPAFYGSHHEVVPLQRPSSRKCEKVDVVGPVCESSDCFAAGRRLANSVRSGDFLAILSAGAYGFSMSSNYNSRPRPAEVLVTGSRARLIRERETYSDLIRGEKA